VVARPGPRVARAPPRPEALAALADPPTIDPLVAAEIARLHHVSDDTPGITRERIGEGKDSFVYRDPQGRLIRDSDTLARIRALVIPPAWTAVWICPDADGHIQATGRDARGRKQYLYHPRWRQVRDETKFEHMLSFGRALPRLRQRVETDLNRDGLPREKVLAAVVRLMERSLSRIGNPEYAKQNESFGLTTLRNDHVRIAEGGRIELDFRGKHGVHHHKVVTDPKLAQILENCRDLPGSELFKYVGPDGQWHRIASEHVNAYLHETAGRTITAKDFRTWAATNLAVLECAFLHAAKPTKRAAAAVVKRVAEHLGNTPAVCRKSYIHPRVLSSYLDGSLKPVLAAIEQSARAPELWAVEGFVLRLLEQWEAADRPWSTAAECRG
jgi:DNA topoisomerase I